MELSSKVKEFSYGFFGLLVLDIIVILCLYLLSMIEMFWKYATGLLLMLPVLILPLNLIVIIIAFKKLGNYGGIGAIVLSVFSFFLSLGIMVIGAAHF